MLINLDSIPSFYKQYVKQVDIADVGMALRKSGFRMQELIHSIPANKADHAYLSGKWTVREVLCHMIDTERIMAYRALCFARNDKTPLPAFEENDYAPNANAAGRGLSDIAREMAHLRTSTLDMFNSFTQEMMTRIGKASGCEMSVLALGFIIAGHETHHRGILTERYLSTS